MSLFSPWQLAAALALASAAGGGCRQAAPATAATPTPSVARPAASGTLAVSLLRARDLSRLFRTLPADPADIVEPMNGFFGPDHYRIELVFTDVARDPRRLACYQVRGKSRYKGQVLPLVGTLELTQVQPQPDSVVRGYIAAAYTALGWFELRQAGPGAGTFRGRLAIDWAIMQNGQVCQFTPEVRRPGPKNVVRIREVEPSTKTPTLGGGILYDGTWTSAAGQVQPVVWAADLLAYHGPQVLSDFAVGGRTLNVNPKYARLGWDDYWRNDEWWTDSLPPRPSL